MRSVLFGFALRQLLRRHPPTRRRTWPALSQMRRLTDVAEECKACVEKGDGTSAAAPRFMIGVGLSMAGWRRLRRLLFPSLRWQLAFRLGRRGLPWANGLRMAELTSSPSGRPAAPCPAACRQSSPPKRVARDRERLETLTAMRRASVGVVEEVDE
ncbi:uncharacterized protein J3D65DRAFT_620853 [Phyllosticta citribraziliensis]|uniref:Uncharacterized protein n=1 Tax=Phyllosticta citribraziliensis TaxID=989973 RepID=A0ABR1LSA4_9PEZI